MRQTFTNRAAAAAVALLLVLGACGKDDERPKKPASRTRSTIVAFEAQGSTVEASRSGDPAPESGDPASGSGVSPSPSPSPGRAAAAPGSLTLKLTSYSAKSGRCDFEEEQTLVAVYTGKTRFEPKEATADPAFPKNLQGSELTVKGRIITSEGCLLIADRVAQTPPEPPPEASPASKKLSAGKATPVRPAPVKVIQSPAPLPPSTPKRSTFRPSLPGAPG